MNFLLDECVPIRVRNTLRNHDVDSAAAPKWRGLTNGGLLIRAELEGFDLLVIADKNMRDLLPWRPAIAVIFSIVEAAKENGLNPYAYVNHLFERLPNLDSRDSATLRQLPLPWNAKLQ
jgi:hypothetical protein